MLRLFRFAAKVEVWEKTDFGKIQFLRHPPDDARGYVTELSAFTRFIREQNTEEDPQESSQAFAISQLIRTTPMFASSLVTSAAAALICGCLSMAIGRRTGAFSPA
jgi:hypothetical protein